MGIINRTLDASEQKESIKISASPMNTAGEVMLPIERACTITDAKISLIGISGTPNFLLKGLRFIAGTGGSSFAIGSTFAVTAYGTSGYLSFSLPASGSSQLALQKGDMLVLTAGGANAAAVSAVMDVVVQNVSDVKTWY
jgi:hypothetical protein